MTPVRRKTPFIITWARPAVAVVFSLLLLAGCGRGDSTAPEPADDDAVVATVNGRSITVERFNKSYVRHLIRTGANDTPAGREQHLARLLQTFLLAEEGRRLGLDETAEFKEHADRQLRLALGARFLDLEMDSVLVPLSEADVREAFRASKERVALRHLFFGDPTHARVAWERLEDGADFVGLANEVYRTGVFDSTAGYLGFARYADLDDAIAEAAVNLEVGRHSAPVRSRYGWHILRVEERLRTPLLTESEFQVRRAGVAGRATVGRNRLARDRFIRSLMGSLDVRVDPEASVLVIDAVRQALGEQEPERSRLLLRRTEVEGIRAGISPETVLLTYTMGGKELSFTAGDYARWLPELPYDEVRHRTVASVGRALRNDVLALKGLERGLDRDPYVLETVNYTESSFLADRMQEHVWTDPVVRPEDAELAEAYRRLGHRTLKEVRADYWSIAFSGLREAEVALSEIKAGERSPSDFAAFEEFEDTDVRDSKPGDFVRRAPLRQPVILCADEGTCFVMRVDDRRVSYTEFEDGKEKLRDKLSAVLTTAVLTDSLFRIGEVQVDSSLFRRMSESR